MSRGLSTANATATEAQVVRPRRLVQIDFDAPTGTLYVHDGIGDLTADDWDGTSRTWTGVGDLGSIDVIEEGDDLSPRQMEFSLTGIDSTIVGAVATDDTVLRKVYYMVVLLDAAGSLIDDPFRVFKGRINEPRFSMGAESRIDIVAESFLVALDRKNGRLFNDADQQERFSADVGLEYLPQMIDLRLRWGGDTKHFGNSGGGGIPIFGPSLGGAGPETGNDFDIR